VTTPTPPAEEDSQGSVQAQAQEAQTHEESFFDPTKVPEELKPAYKQMQADYTKKTQEIATIRKEHESLKAQAQKYSRYEQYAPILEEMLSPNGQQTSNPALSALEVQLAKQGYSKEAIDLMKLGVDFTLKQFNQTQQQSRQQEWFSQQIQTAGAVDPRLNDQTLVYQSEDGAKMTFGSIVESIVATLPNWQRDPVAATKQAIKLVDAMMSKAKVEGKQELSDSAQTKARKFAPTNTSSQETQATGAPKSIKEAFKLAKQELNL
jgi:hypothetical protein